MTIKEIISNRPHGTDEEWITFTEVENLIKDYSAMKCEELLEIVAEKAKVENSCYGIYENEVATVLYTENEGSYFVNAESILNAVNLEEFIV